MKGDICPFPPSLPFLSHSVWGPISEISQKRRESCEVTESGGSTAAQAEFCGLLLGVLITLLGRERILMGKYEFES